MCKVLILNNLYDFYSAIFKPVKLFLNILRYEIFFQLYFYHHMRYHFLKYLFLMISLWIGLGESNSSGQDVANQIWVGVLPSYTFKNGIRLLGQFDYRGVTNHDDNWARFFNQYNFRITVLNWLDLHTGSYFLNTHHDRDYEELDSWEIRPFVGVRMHLTQNKRINVRNYSRLEKRFFFFYNIGKKDSFIRLRNRLEIISALTKPNLNEDGVLYLNVDGEIFFNVFERPEERFVNLFQSRLGPGYRFNYNWRIETFYIIQLSKNSITDNFKTQSNILSLRLRYYFN